MAIRVLEIVAVDFSYEYSLPIPFFSTVRRGVESES